MPPPTASQKPTKASAKSAHAAAASSNANANGSAIGSADKEKTGASGQLAKPDQAKYNAEQDEINKEIAAVKAKLVGALYIISLAWPKWCTSPTS